MTRHPAGDSFNHPLHKLLDLDKELRNIRGWLKVEMVKTVQLEEHIVKEKLKLSKIKNNTAYSNGIQGDIRNRIDSISLLKGRLTNQVI